MRVEVGHRFGEGRYLLGQPVVGVLDPPVQVGHAVVGLAVKVQVVGVVQQLGPKSQGQPLLQEPDQGVDESGWDGYCEPLQDEKEEVGLENEQCYVPFYRLLLEIRSDRDVSFEWAYDSLLSDLKGSCKNDQESDTH